MSRKLKRALIIVPLVVAIAAVAAVFLLRRECGKYNSDSANGGGGTPPKYCVCKSSEPRTGDRPGRGQQFAYPVRYCGFMMSAEEILTGYYQAMNP